ncbi:MAG: hypothetical protein A3H57_02570 [Candidatus Taylorbacteria bacterium RIFCSPLOWO2_02_FULL_43_11]|uniref:Uncharacterized protein n=1 Tax=Candidatus Taylorbacteria bacterium RIFCSPHIGHO2_02_FULL_43_32b TaxID=1802306 RepID=A0A1G2MIJ5_9BACT|nr:MAG: hypothetical protein A2743_00320 [Candidatus Taylorbacteria bacterium RIFCSPHIGHO2_01_FULL_43_47]OHA22812.1 MAG: hypothetical protein A3C72_02765 [Candidatus Taylorbacteria bacterium RIFCSPHIGHO2_02_FULL_43_32b]OHA30866.1 MAG: hypothetical protein A3B08_01570 [Candidatus Taylorbacteria bacterium RIFCSPLOWO2_01_FULL_43_44]OHA35263.1 MAG: hypothetical protein A3H57_02570 [Candidatus Taylorbacteria bacterium RIFCSPLOWO2_02_FULL_43_11]
MDVDRVWISFDFAPQKHEYLPAGKFLCSARRPAQGFLASKASLCWQEKKVNYELGIRNYAKIVDK